MVDSNDSYEQLKKKYSFFFSRHYLPLLEAPNPYLEVDYPLVEQEEELFRAGYEASGRKTGYRQNLEIKGPINSYSFLNNYPKLKRIELSDSCLTSFEGMPILPELRYFLMNWSCIPNFEHFPELPKVEVLLIHTFMQSFEHMPVFPRLKRLAVSTELKNFHHFPLQPVLEKLIVSTNKLVSFEGMPVLPRLKMLDVSDNFLTSFKELPPHPNLKELIVSATMPYIDTNERSYLEECYRQRNNHICSFEEFPIFPRLETIWAERIGLESFAGMPKLPKVKRLYLKDNSIRSFAELPSLPELEYIDLSNNKIKTLDGMPLLPNLRSLTLCGNPIKNGAALKILKEKAPRLNDLDLRNSPLETLEDFPKPPHLNSLWLEHTQIKSLAPLYDFKGLNYLFLKNTPLQTLAEMPIIYRTPDHGEVIDIDPLGEDYSVIEGWNLDLPWDFLKNIPDSVYQWYKNKQYDKFTAYYHVKTSELIDKAQHDKLDPLYYPRIVQESSPEVQHFLIKKLGRQHSLSKLLIENLVNLEVPIKNGDFSIKL
ncbi:MAG: leucine-rich repeat domain-containing protein [Candidatus Lokiarchaeota archaeon]|nr:leucine-rich repeat domain-containing protein [Candidatus Harpocratesius repetitus]